MPKAEFTRLNINASGEEDEVKKRNLSGPSETEFLKLKAMFQATTAVLSTSLTSYWGT
jgi:hypothetical protein